MPRYYCDHCNCETDHFNVKDAAGFTQVTRTSVYTWIRRGLVHGLVRPSGRRFICANSLLQPRIDENLGCAVSGVDHRGPRPARPYPADA